MSFAAMLNECAMTDVEISTPILKTSCRCFFVGSTKVGKNVQSILAPVEGLLEMHLRVVSKRNVGFAVFIQGTNFTTFDVIHPAMQTQRIISQSHSY